MAARWRGSCPLTCFPTPAVASGFDYPWAGCVPVEPACVSSKVVAREWWSEAPYDDSGGSMRSGDSGGGLTEMDSRRLAFAAACRALSQLERLAWPTLVIVMAGSRVSTPTRQPYGSRRLGGRNHSPPELSRNCPSIPRRGA